MILELIGASKSFGRTQALDTITVEFRPGEIVAVLGLNGAGKSTLLRALAGMYRLDGGTLQIDGVPFRRENLEQRRQILLVPDLPVLHPGYSALRNIGIYLRQYERHETPGMAGKVADLLEEFDLLTKAESSLETLSRGQFYKAGLAASIAVGPRAWLLDEPFASGMDNRGIQHFRRYAREASGEGRTVIYTTQMPELAAGFSDRVLVLDGGRLGFFGKPEDLAVSRDPAIRRLLDDSGEIGSKP